MKERKNEIMRIKELAKKLKGIQTLNSIADILSVNKEKAVYYIYKLRKKGYVKTKRLSDNKRVYNISYENKLKGIDYTELINNNSPIKISMSETNKVYGRKPSLEETLIFAINTKKLRTILASLALFKKIKNWHLLYKLAKNNNMLREVCVLYDLSRTIIKTRKINKKFKKLSLPKKHDKYKYLIEGLKSKDFKLIEKIWKVYLPFNKEDLEDYK